MPTVSIQREGLGVSVKKGTLEMESHVKVGHTYEVLKITCHTFIALCSRSLQLDFGRVNITGLTAVYSCYEGYVLDGEKTRRCLSDGSWTRSGPSCRPLCKQNFHWSLECSVVGLNPIQGSSFFLSQERVVLSVVKLFALPLP